MPAPGAPPGPGADLLRLNTGVPPTPPGSQESLGLSRQRLTPRSSGLPHALLELGDYEGPTAIHLHHHGGHNKHDGLFKANQHTRHGFRPGTRPLLAEMLHELAGSAALMLLVLSTISTPLIGLIHIVIFGVGSIGAMMLMSTLVGLPLRLTATRIARASVAMP